MSEIAIVCAESSLVEVKSKGLTYPCVVLFGRDKEGNRRTYRKKFFPYFYLQERDFRKLKDTKYLDDLAIQDVSATIARGLMKQAMTKISVIDCGRVTDTIKFINKLNKVKNVLPDEKTIFTYEADLSKADLLPLRFLIDYDIKSGIRIDKDGTITPIDLEMPLRKWYLDFEAYSFRNYSSGMNDDEPINMVSIWDTYDRKMYTLYTNNAKWCVKWQESNFLKELIGKFEKDGKPITFDHEVIKFSTEQELLDYLVEMVREKDPDMFLAWNYNRYDLPKWKSRMDYLNKKCVHKFADISPMGSILPHSRPIRIKGRMGFDLMVAFKQFTDAELRSYSLAFITEEEKLGFPKIPFEGTAGYTWDERPDIVFMRNVYDVLIEKALDEKYELTELYDDMRKDFGALFHETFVPYRVIDSALMRLVRNKVVLRTTSYAKKDDDQEKLLGAIVQEARVGSDYWVFQFDFSREYPNIIKAFNISPETFRFEDNGNCYHISYVNPKNDQEMHFYFDKKRKGLLPTLIDFFFKKRDEYEKKRMEAIDNKEPDHIIKKWERKAYNMKKKSNAIYGVMDFPKFRLSREECTQATAVIGRIAAEELVKYVVGELGYILKYGDTDSIFIKAKSTTPEACLEEGKALVKKMNEHLTNFFTEKYGVEKAPSDLAFQELYQKAVFFGKKNYAVKGVWNEKKGWKVFYKFKGIASIRTDSSNLEKAVMEQLLRLVLDDEKVSTIKAYSKRVLKEFDKRKYGPIDIAYPAQLKKTFYFDKKRKCWRTTYAFMTKPKDEGRKPTMMFSAHARSAIYTNMFLNTDFVQGDKPRRLPVKFPKGFKKEQSTLFKTDKVYPTEWIYKGRTGGIKEDVVILVKDISIVEDMRIPEFFLRNIDYDRIRKRLEGKIYNILCTSNIMKEGESLDAK